MFKNAKNAAMEPREVKTKEQTKPKEQDEQKDAKPNS